MLEMMGAMGIRDARRLRGEAGRAMFFDDLERECFAPIFGNLRADSSSPQPSSSYGDGFGETEAA
jgi:hypothetical protein